MRKRKKRYAIAICLCVLGLLTVLGVVWLSGAQAGAGENLALRKGVIATCDSTENDELSADKAIDGNATELSSRWSSENNREDASHYIELEFPEEISVSFVILRWERRNVLSYALEGSLDGEEWENLRHFDVAPETKNQEIVLDEPVRLRYLRLSTYKVSDNAEHYYDLYQNVSLYEFEVYGDKPTAYCLGRAAVGHREDGSRYLILPDAPEGYEVTFLGADYEQVIGADGTVYDTIQDKEVTVGLRVENIRKSSDVREVSQILTVPAYDGPADDTEGEIRLAEEQDRRYNECPRVIPGIAEWQGGQGDFEAGDNFRVIVEKDSGLQAVGTLFTDKYLSMTGRGVEVTEGSVEDARPGDVYLGYAQEANGLGKEGYTCDITDMCVIKAETETGIRWGTVTLLQLFVQRGGVLPQGQIRDYPLYQVRGFGIDVARKAVSMDMLYAIVEKMSYYKMNDLAIHLNDNTILSTSGLNDSVESVMTADSAFRLESDIVNDAGKRLTSQEYAYTKEEFARFIRKAKDYGVTVVPEIDTPAHSLSITKLYPEYALTSRPESVDQIDLGNEDAVELVSEIWQEALSKDDAAFRDAEIVNIGMDEYYGDGEQYRRYAVRIAEIAREAGKTVRMWGSLSNIAGKTMPEPDGLQMNLWSTAWAEPMQMYEEGYSIVNMQNNHLYVIPGGGYDYLNNEELFTEWAPNKFYDYNTEETVPCYSSQMLGAAYMIWNDMSGNLDLGLCEYDLYDRFEQPLAILGAKLWGMEHILEEGETYEDFERRAGKIYEDLFDVRDGKNRLYGEETGLEPDYDVRLRVYLEKSQERAEEKVTAQEAPGQDKDTGGVASKKTTDRDYGGQVLAESDSPYGVWAFYAAEPETGQVGFAREGRTYTWDYTLPTEQWVELRIVGKLGQTSLYADGKLVGTLGSQEPFEEYATFVFPVQRTGEETGNFWGEVEWLELSQ